MDFNTCPPPRPLHTTLTKKVAAFRMPTSRSYPRHLVEFQQETRIYWGFFVLFFWAKMKKASIVFKLSFILFITRFTLVAYLSWKPYFFLYPTYPYGALLSILVVCSRNLMLTGAPFLGGAQGAQAPSKFGARMPKLWVTWGLKIIVYTGGPTLTLKNGSREKCIPEIL